MKDRNNIFKSLCIYTFLKYLELQIGFLRGSFESIEYKDDRIIIYASLLSEVNAEEEDQNILMKIDESVQIKIKFDAC